MIKILLLSLLVSFSAWSKVNLELKLHSSAVKQGQIASGSLIVKETNGNSGLAGLKGKTLAKTLYLLNVSPFMGKNGQLTADVKIIFALVPKGNSVSETINNEEISIDWVDIQVSPTEASNSFLFGDFEISSRIVLIPWLVGLVGFGLFIFLGLRIRAVLIVKTNLKSRRIKLKDEIISCTIYDDVVLMWRKKKRYLEEFPQIESHFRTLEETLFKYQFKAQRTEHEVNAVMEAFQVFRSSVIGDLNGI